MEIPIVLVQDDPVVGAQRIHGARGVRFQDVDKEIKRETLRAMGVLLVQSAAHFANEPRGVGHNVEIAFLLLATPEFVT